MSELKHFEILHRHTGKVLFEGEFETKLDCLISAFGSGANLSDANLRYANLRYDFFHLSLAGTWDLWTTDGGKTIRIGCKTKTPDEWRSYGEDDDYRGSVSDINRRFFLMVITEIEVRFGVNVKSEIAEDLEQAS